MSKKQKIDDRQICLSMTVDDANVIIGALSERPFKEVLDLIGRINKQATEQLNGCKSKEVS